jgi:hypothetical protein
VCYVQRFLARLGFLAIILLALACSGCFDRGASAVPAQVYQLSQPQLAAENELDADAKAMKDALAAYEQAGADTVKACPAVVARSIDDCEKVCALFNVTKKDAKERMDRLEKITLDIIAKGGQGYKEMADELSPLCVREHLKECGVVEIMQSKSLDDRAKSAAELKLAAQIDPVCGAAVAFWAQKGQEFHDASDRAERDVDRAREVDRENEQNELNAERLSQPPPRYPVDTSCFATPGGGGFNCYSY